MSDNQIAHSKIGASSYYRWKACPGSVRLSEGVPNQSSPYAQEGTVAHDLAAEMLEDFFFKKGKPLIPPQYSAENMEAIKVYIDYVKSEAKNGFCNASEGHILIEQRFQLESIHPDLFGTSDCTLYFPREKKLKVIDYKHGAGIAVDVENNLQLQYYGLGALLSVNLPVETVELCIVQPRCDHPDGRIRNWSFNAIELLDFAADLKRDAKATEDPNAKINPGTHCRFCPAAAANVCPALREKALAVAKSEFGPVDKYDPARLKEALDILPILESWVKQVREFAYGEACHGRTPEGYKLVEKRAMRKWRVSEKEVVDELLTFVPDGTEIYKKSLLSPAQIEKQLKKDDKKTLANLIVKESSGHTLVQNSDKRPAVFLDAKHDFKPIKGE